MRESVRAHERECSGLGVFGPDLTDHSFNPPGLPSRSWQGHTWGAAGTATPLTERRKEKINGWLASADTEGVGKAGSTSGRSVTGVTVFRFGGIEVVAPTWLVSRM